MVSSKVASSAIVASAIVAISGASFTELIVNVNVDGIEVLTASVSPEAGSDAITLTTVEPK